MNARRWLRQAFLGLRQSDRRESVHLAMCVAEDQIERLEPPRLHHPLPADDAHHDWKALCDEGIVAEDRDGLPVGLGAHQLADSCRRRLWEVEASSHQAEAQRSLVDSLPELREIGAVELGPDSVEMRNRRHESGKSTIDRQDPDPIVDVGILQVPRNDVPNNRPALGVDSSNDRAIGVEVRADVDAPRRIEPLVEEARELPLARNQRWQKAVSIFDL